MSRSTRDIASALFFGTVALVFLVSGRDLDMTARDIPGPGLFPLSLAAITLVLAVALVAKTLRTPKSTLPADDVAPIDPALELGPPTEFEEAEEAPSYSRPFLVWLAVLACALLLPTLGFLISTVVLMVVVILLVERRRDVVSLATIALLPVVFYGLFAVLLDVRLPTGLLG